MAIRITCPGCKTSLTLDDDARGTKVRCDECDKVLSIPAGNKRAKEDAVQESSKVKQKAKASPPEDDDEPDDEDRTAKKKKKKGKKGKAGSSMPLIIAGAGVAVLLLVGGGVSAFFLLRSDPATAAQKDQQAKLAQKDAKAADDKKGQPGGAENKDGKEVDTKKNDEGGGGIRIAPKIEEGSPTKKGGTGIVQGVRGAVYRTERKSELKQLALSFNQFSDEYKGANRTYENYLDYIKTYGAIHKAVKEGYYKINVKARLEGSNIIAYERDKDHAGYLCAMGDGDIRYVPEAEWKMALGIK